MSVAPLPSVRVVAYSSANRGLPTVNILTSPTAEKANNQKHATQITATQAKTQTHKTVQASPSFHTMPAVAGNVVGKSAGLKTNPWVAKKATNC